MNRLLTILLALLVALSGSAGAATAPMQPDQPASGPGGRVARFTDVRSDRVGAAPTGADLFWPDTDRDTQPLPVVIFVHGFSAVNPETYRGWIDHIVRRGAIVIYPDYQTAIPIETAPTTYQANAVAGIRAAVTLLETGEPIAADIDRVAIVGHSLGGVLALNLAAVAAPLGLPVPDAIMSVEPGGCLGCGGLSALLRVPFADLSQIDPATLAIVVTGDVDEVVAEAGATLAWQMMTSIPQEQRDYIRVHSDRTGQPPLIADHYAPQTGGDNGEIDALDWYGSWKWLDLLTDCTFSDLSCSYALGGSAAQLDMEAWSDGTPILPPITTDMP